MPSDPYHDKQFTITNYTYYFSYYLFCVKKIWDFTLDLASPSSKIELHFNYQAKTIVIISLAKYLPI